MARTPEGAVLGEWVADRVGAEAGGFLCGISISNDGLTKAVCADAFGSYVRGPSDDTWRQLFEVGVIDDSEYDPYPTRSMVDGPGGHGIAVAPSDNTRIVGGFRGKFFFSSDTGATMTANALAPKAMVARQGDGRWWNPRIAIHPSNPDIVLCGTNSDGVYYTTDFGATELIPVNGSIPENTVNGFDETPYLVAFDSTGKAYIYVQGTGLYSASSVSGTFTAVGGTGAPTDFCSNLVVDADDAVWVVERVPGTGGLIHKYESGTWTIPAAFADLPDVLTVAVNPNNTGQVVAMGSSNKTIWQSLDRGATTVGDFWNLTWPPAVGVYYSSPDVIYLEGNAIFPSQAIFNPAEPNELWCAHGVGVGWSNPPTTHVRWDWASQSAGIWMLVSNDFLTVPGTDRMVALFWDKPIWVFGSDVSDRTLHQKTADPAVVFDHTWQGDYAADDLDYWVVSSGFVADTSAYSEDHGDTWTPIFPDGWPDSGHPGGLSASCAVNTRAQQIIVPGNSQRAIATEDEWATWDYLPIDPDVDGLGNWIAAYYVRRMLVTADKERPGTFAIVMNGSNQGAGVQGIWVTNNGPLTGPWTQRYSGRIDSTGDSVDFWQCTLKYIPGKSGELLYTTGPTFNSRLLHFTNDAEDGPFDLGATWNITKVDRFGFGKARPGETYPAIYFFGEVNGQLGFYVSFDFFATEPELVFIRPGGIIDLIGAVNGDVNRFGRAFLGYGGSGAAYVDFKDVRRAS